MKLSSTIYFCFDFTENFVKLTMTNVIYLCFDFTENFVNIMCTSTYLESDFKENFVTLTRFHRKFRENEYYKPILNLFSRKIFG